MAEAVWVPNDSLVIVADGESARVFRVNRKGDDLRLQESERLTPQDTPDGGPAGHRPPEQTAQQTGEATFAKQLANYLNQMALAGKFDVLVLIADPQTLGQIRGLLHAEVISRLKADIAKTLTNSPVADIEAQLA